MITSSKLSEQLRIIEVNASILFNELVENGKEFNFVKASGGALISELKENGELGVLPIIEVRNSMNGNSFDIYVVSVDKDAIECITIDGENERFDKFSDISDISYKLILINEMENLLK